MTAHNGDNANMPAGMQVSLLQGKTFVGDGGVRPCPERRTSVRRDVVTTTSYLVKAVDWLAKIAEDHGSTVSAIWNHPDNAEHRAKRGSPDVLYPGDVLHIPVAAPLEPPVGPPQPPGAQPPPVLPPVPPADLPWPYPPQPLATSPLPTWTCPEGTCDCHPVTEEEEEPIEHKIVFFDPQGKRMPFARCRIHERGQLITEEPTKADGLGELTLRIRASTLALHVEWAPATLPRHDSMPYRKLYHARPDENERIGTQKRLSNLGFAQQLSLKENIKDYQLAYAQMPSGELADVKDEIRTRHDDGLLPMVIGNRTQDEGAASNTSRAAVVSSGDPTTKSFFSDPTPVAPSLRLVNFLQQDGSTGGGASGGAGRQGGVVPDVGNLFLMVSLDGNTGPLNPADVNVRLRPNFVAGMTDAQAKQLRKPLDPPGGVIWPDPNNTNQYLVFAFLDVPKGTFSALVVIENVMKGSSLQAGGLSGCALGSAEIEVKTGLLTLGAVLAQKNRPILSVNDPLLDLDHPRMQRRRKVLATIHSQFPQSEGGSPTKRPPYRPPYDQGEYKYMYLAPGPGQNSCTPINARGIMEKAGTPPGDYGMNPFPKNGKPSVHPGFVPFEANPALQQPLPSVGDNYYLVFEDGKKVDHVGIVVQSSSDGGVWLCADGGQPDRTTDFMNGPTGFHRYYNPRHPTQNFDSREGAYVVPRLFTKGTDSAGTLRGKLGNLYIFPTSADSKIFFLGGLTDITHPQAAFPQSGYTKDHSEEHYLELKKLLKAIPTRVEADRARCLQTEQAATATP